MIEILHVSDLHFGKSAAQNQRAKSLLDSIHRQFPFEGHDNRYLLVTGDITQSGEKDEYELAGQALSPFKSQIFVTPGNHDYGSLFGTDYSKRKARNFDDPFAKELGFVYPFFDKKVFTCPLQDQSDNSTLMMIGLNSCAKEGIFYFAQGEVGDEQRDELDRELATCDPQTPKLIFLHHIPNKAAEWELIMTLRDWRELMAVVRDRVDVLAFGHQGKVMHDGGKFTPLPAPSRPMKSRSRVIGTKRALVLDANNSVQEQAFYLITSDGKQLTAKVVPV